MSCLGQRICSFQNDRVSCRIIPAWWRKSACSISRTVVTLCPRNCSIISLVESATSALLKGWKLSDLFLLVSLRIYKRSVGSDLFSLSLRFSFTHTHIYAFYPGNRVIYSLSGFLFQLNRNDRELRFLPLCFFLFTQCFVIFSIHTLVLITELSAAQFIFHCT